MALSIPAFHVSNRSRVEGGGAVFISTRKDSVSSGVFKIKIGAKFDPAVDTYPSGGFELTVDLNDGLKGTFKATSIELINSHGKANPTVFLTGQCSGSGAARERKGLRYWLMIANNQPRRPNERDTPDIVGFAIHDRTGARVTYGTGPLQPGGKFQVKAE